MPGPQTLIAANWKMHGSVAFADELCGKLAELPVPRQVTVVVLPPSVYLGRVADALRATRLQWGAQNAHGEAEGAFTGEVAAEMIRDLGGSWLLVGHSERRAYFGETDELLAAKYVAALRAGLTPIFCVGETLAEREADRATSVVSAQLRALAERAGPAAVSRGVVAYEPVWAIGTGETATPEQAQEMHQLIRGELRQLDPELGTQVPILYGGSMNADNAAGLLAQQDIDGGLVGGASLQAASFAAIIEAAARQAGVTGT